MRMDYGDPAWLAAMARITRRRSERCASEVGAELLRLISADFEALARNVRPSR